MLKEGMYVDDRELQRKLDKLASLGTRRTKAKTAIRRAGKPMERAAKSMAKAYQSDDPHVLITKHGKREHLWKSIAIINSKKYRNNTLLWVGPRKSQRYRAYHGHILEKGTTARYTEKGAYRGRITAKRFMLRAYNITQRAVKVRMGRELDKLIKEIVR